MGQVDVDEAKLTYQSELFNAIYDGELQEELDLIPSKVKVITGLDAAPIVTDDGPLPEEDDSLPGAAIGGIVIGSLVFLAIPICYLYSRSQANREAQDKRGAEQQVQEVREEKPSEIEPVSVDTGVYTDAAVFDSSAQDAGKLGASTKEYEPGVSAQSLASGTLGAIQPNYGRGASRSAVEAMEAGEDIVAEPEMDILPDSSSNAGSSGWSSKSGLSSFNTGSMDDSTDAAAAAGATLAAIGVSSNLSRKLEAERKR